MGRFNETEHPRGQAGNNGQFRNKENTAPSAVLAPPVPGSGEDRFLARKREALLRRGFVPATPGLSGAGTPRSRRGIENWWRDAQLRSEVRTDGKSYPQMPDDYTPSASGGRALSGKRRTYRKLYQSGEIAVRMPSASAIRRYSAELGNETFDIPVSAEGPAGNPISGHVRVTQTSPGRWSVTAINMPANAQAKVSEAVNAVLEARRPSFALGEVEKAGGLLHAARERQAAAGTKLTSTDQSGWIRSAGYNDSTGEVVLDLQGRHYGYDVPRGVYDYVISAPSPGSAYNRLIKGKYPSHSVTQCETCGRWSGSDRAHSCRSHRAPTGKVTLYGRRIRAFILADEKTPA